jgi:hypothetical protein
MKQYLESFRVRAGLAADDRALTEAEESGEMSAESLEDFVTDFLKSSAGIWREVSNDYDGFPRYYDASVYAKKDDNEFSLTLAFVNARKSGGNIVDSDEAKEKQERPEEGRSRFDRDADDSPSGQRAAAFKEMMSKLEKKMAAALKSKGVRLDVVDSEFGSTNTDGLGWVYHYTTYNVYP